MLYTRPNSSQEDIEKRDYSECFHFSLAWSLATDVDAKTSSPALDEFWEDSEAQELEVMVDTALVKIGNAVHSIKLDSQTKAQPGGGIR